MAAGAGWVAAFLAPTALWAGLATCDVCPDIEIELSELPAPPKASWILEISGG